MATMKIIYDKNTTGKCIVSPNTISDRGIKVGDTFTITANSGYKFDGVTGEYNETSPVIKIFTDIINSRNTNNHIYFNRSISDDNKTITITCIKDTNCNDFLCTIVSNRPILNDTPSYPKLTITKNLTNVTMSPDVNSIEIDGTSKVITLTANSGYQFSDVPKLTISGIDHNFSLSDNVYTLDVNTIGIQADVTGTITATATQIVVNPTVTITKNLTNVTMSPDVNSIEIDGTSKVITLTANSGYEFSGVPYFEWNRTVYYFEQSGSSYIYDLNTLINENASIKIYATATAKAQTKNVTNSLTNCSVTPSFTSMTENTTYNLTLNANSGFKFVTTPTLKINNRNRTVLDFTKVTDYQYTLSFTAESSYFDTDENADLSGVAVEETPIVNKYGAIQVYNPSTSDMASLATKRFKENGTVGGVTYSDIDLGKYITQFKRVFFNVETSTKQNILLGVHDTQINTNTVYNDDVTIDCGTVLIQGSNNNELDAKIYKIKLVLPFYEVVELPSIYMNKRIHIVYQANIVTGYADILINEVVSNTDLLIVKYRCKISQDLPYILNYDKLNGSLSDMQLNTLPKIILQKNNTFIDKGYNTYKEDLISNEVGYFEVKDIVSMSVNATQKEKDLIENLLKSGVYL